MSSRITQRAKKQDKFRRHIANIDATASNDGVANANNSHNNSSNNNKQISRSRSTSSSNRTNGKEKAPSSSAAPSETPFPRRAKSTFYALNSNPSQDSVGSVKSNSETYPVRREFKGGLTGRMNGHRKRMGRSLTRASSVDKRDNSNSSSKVRPSSSSESESSEEPGRIRTRNSDEPGRIKTRSRPGRSLTRALSVEKGSKSTSAASRAASRSASRSTSRPPIRAVNSNPPETSKASFALGSSSRFRARSLSRNRYVAQPKRSHSQDSSASTKKDVSTEKTSSVRPLSGRSPFSRLMAEKRQVASGTKMKKSKKELYPTTKPVATPCESSEGDILEGNSASKTAAVETEELSTTITDDAPEAKNEDTTDDTQCEPTTEERVSVVETDAVPKAIVDNERESLNESTTTEQKPIDVESEKPSTEVVDIASENLNVTTVDEIENQAGFEDFEAMDSGNGLTVVADRGPLSPVEETSHIGTPKTTLLDECEETPKDDANTPILSDKIISNHVSRSGEVIVDEFGDPPLELEEMESEVSIGGPFDKINLQHCLPSPSESLLDSFIPSPTKALVSPTESILDSFAPTPTSNANAEADVVENQKKEEGSEIEKKENAYSIKNEKKENDDEGKITPDTSQSSKAAQTASAWNLTNSQFSNLVNSVTKSSDNDMDMLFDTWVTEKDTNFSNASLSNPYVKEDSSGEKKNESGDRSGTSDKTSSDLEKNTDGMFDMFDTSSWAAGTETGFSNTSISKLDVDIESERNFVEMMKEEMKHRALTEEESDMLFAAQKAINEAEEKAIAERSIVQKDDEPLIRQVADSNGANDFTGEGSLPLEDRLKEYSNVKPDEDSESSTNNSSESDSKDGDDNVEYVDHQNEEELDELDSRKVEDVSSSLNGSLVSSTDVPTLAVAAATAEKTSSIPKQSLDNDTSTPTQESYVIPKTLEELKMATPPPPPPPPGIPKKRKAKKKKTKSSSRGKGVVPLISPPPKEKMKKWEDQQQKTPDYAKIMKEKLESSETKKSDVSSGYFHFKVVDESQENAASETVCNSSVPSPRQERECNESQDSCRDAQVIEENTIEKEIKQNMFDNEAEDEWKEMDNSKSSTEEETQEAVTVMTADLIDRDQSKNDDFVQTESPKKQTDSTEDTNSQLDKAHDHDSISAIAQEVIRKNEEAALSNESKNNLWRKEVADAMGLVERLEEEYNQDFPLIDSYLTPLLSDDEISKKLSEDQGMLYQGVSYSKMSSMPKIPKIPSVGYSTSIPSSSQDSKDICEAEVEGQFSGESKQSTAQLIPDVQKDVVERSDTPESDCSDDVGLTKDRLLSVEIFDDPPMDREKTESMFYSPKASSRSTKANDFNEKKRSSDSILTDFKMADKVAMASSAAASTFEYQFSPRMDKKDTPKNATSAKGEILSWFSREVLKTEPPALELDTDVSEVARGLLENRQHFNSMCRYVAERINEVSIQMKPDLKFSESVLSSFDTENPFVSKTMSSTSSGDSGDESTTSVEQKRVLLKPVILSDAMMTLSNKYLAANFVSFIYMASRLAKVASPFGDSNPFLAMIVSSSLNKTTEKEATETTQDLLFEKLGGKAENLIEFVYKVKASCDADMTVLTAAAIVVKQSFESMDEEETKRDFGRRFIFPDNHPSPFEASVFEAPRIVAAVLSFLGDPVTVCRMKAVNHSCRQIVEENEHTLMQDAVRIGGLNASLRPAFWMWIALEKCDVSNRQNNFSGCDELNALEREAEEGKWHHVIQRDVARSFGNMPPHKTGARFRSDSIVAALVTWGQSRVMKRGVKGGGEPVPIPEIGEQNLRKQKVKRKSTNTSSPPWKCENEDGSDDGDTSVVKSDTSGAPTDTVSDWSAVSPKGSFVGSINDPELFVDESTEEIVLCGNSLSADVKEDLQNKLSYILHSLAATYEDIGYCQGMDYVVAHLLRNLQDTIRLRAAKGTMPAIVSTASSVETDLLIDAENIEIMNKEIDSHRVVEETIVRIMDTFFVSYNLRHMYWPELRCLKTCCRVFERLIQIKLPVLADHFEHHDLNVGLFALGWFQTLFLYLPSMPSATVCHMWDIWLVERSFKIFFRAGTAILFLSQPILLNHELEGMMTYLNTIPDATLLRPDILIPCALNIKVTNRMLQELEDEVMKNPN